MVSRWAVHDDGRDGLIATTNRDRDFPVPPGGPSLTAKLPKWMKAAGDRAELLRAIARMRERLYLR